MAKENINISEFVEKLKGNAKYKEPFKNFEQMFETIGKLDDKELRQSQTHGGGYYDKKQMTEQLVVATHVWMDQIDKGIYQGKPPVEVEQLQSGTKEINISDFAKKLGNDPKYKECFNNFQDTLKSMDNLNDKNLQKYADSSSPQGVTNHYDKKQMTEQLIIATHEWMDQIDKGTYHKQEPLPKEVGKNSQGIFAKAWSAVKNLVNSIVEAGSKMISNHHDKNEILQRVIDRKVKRSLMEAQKNLSKTHDTSIADQKENIKNNINKFTTNVSKHEHDGITPTTGSKNKENKTTKLER